MFDYGEDLLDISVGYREEVYFWHYKETFDDYLEFK